MEFLPLDLLPGYHFSIENKIILCKSINSPTIQHFWESYIHSKVDRFRDYIVC